MEEGKSIVLKKGIVDWVGNYSSFEKEENDEILNLDGKYILPGLVDCHVHLEFTETGENPYASYMTTQTPYYVLMALKNAQDHLSSGFTTLRDCGGHNWGSSLKKAFSSGLFHGPRILAAQSPIVQFGQQDERLPDDLLLAYNLLMKMNLVGTNYPTGVNEMYFAVRERITYGSDFVKILNTGTVYGIGSKLEKTFFREEEMHALVGESHRNGLQIACHSHNDRGIQEALDAGVDTIEHCSYISEETSAKMAKTDSYLIPTHLVDEVRKDPERMKEYPGFMEKMNKIAEVKYENHRIAFEKGAKFALGTDGGAGGAVHGESAKEIGLMVQNIGMTPVQAIQCATICAAKAIQLEDTIASIEVGKAGDVIVISSNPLDDVTILEDVTNIEYVIKEAKIVAEKGVLV
jgi:imidazolonepropionase-like amidohydrolase